MCPGRGGPSSRSMFIHLIPATPVKSPAASEVVSSKMGRRGAPERQNCPSDHCFLRSKVDVDPGSVIIERTSVPPLTITI
jgi:hypothetical protein